MLPRSGMHPLLRLALAGAYCLLVSAGDSATAAGEEPSLSALTIQGAVELALSRNPEILNQRERLAEAEKGVHFAISQLLPSLTGSGSATTQKAASNSQNALFGGEPYNQYGVSLRLVQPLYQSGALLGGLRASQKEREIRQRDLEIASRDLTLSVIQAYYAVIFNQALMETYEKERKVQGQSLETAERYLRIGRGQLIDVLQIKTQMALLTPRIASAENQLKAAASQLATLLHQPEIRALRLEGALQTPEIASIKGLFSNRSELPEILRSATLISQFGDKIAVQMSPNYPSLNVQGTVGHSSYVPRQLFDSNAETWQFGLFLNVPLFSGFSSFSQKAALRAQLAQLEFGQQKLFDSVSYNQIQSERDLELSEVNLGSYKQASELSRQSLTEAQKDFRLQTVNALQFLASEQGNLEANANLIQARYNYIVAAARYCVASGIPLAELVSLLAREREGGRRG